MIWVRYNTHTLTHSTDTHTHTLSHTQCKQGQKKLGISEKYQYTYVRKQICCSCVHRLLQAHAKLCMGNFLVSVNRNKGLQKYSEFSQCFYVGIKIKWRLRQLAVVHVVQGAALNKPLTSKPEQFKR